jgi:hypothetical protein
MLKRSWGNDGLKARPLSPRAVSLNVRMTNIGGNLSRGISSTGKGWEVWFPQDGGSVTAECDNLTQVTWDVEHFEELYAERHPMN